MFNQLLIKNRSALSQSYFTNFVKQTLQTTVEKTNLLDKPPNILVLGNEPGVQMQRCIKCIETCLEKSCYTVYPILTDKFLTEPWLENTSGLIILSGHFQNSLVSQVKTKLKRYLQLGGKVLSFSEQMVNHVQVSKISNFVSTNNATLLLQLLHEEVINLPNTAWSGTVIECTNDKSLISLNSADTSHCLACFDYKDCSMFCTLPLLSTNITKDNPNFVVISYLLHCLGLKSTWNQKDEIVDVCDTSSSPAFFYASDLFVQNEFLQKIFNKIQDDIPLKAPGLKFVTPSCSKNNTLSESVSELTVIYSTDVKDYSAYSNCFDWKTYKEFLSTQNYGKLVLYSDVLPTTMGIFDGIFSKLAMNLCPIAIARQQTKGQGRGGNKWLSPVGCAMFTLVVHVPIQSQLGVALPFLQHLTTVAVVHGIRNTPELQDVDLRVKWPNDIYFGSSVKLGGVIVKSTIYQDVCIASIGCGINISNSKPTVCVNDILQEEYAINRKLKCEEVIAKAVTCLELLINNFQKSGPDSFLQLYYKYWLHSECEVAIEVDDSSISCTIVGIDEFGFLRARRHDNGDVLSLHPDGNSFDIMKGLIAPKKS